MDQLAEHAVGQRVVNAVIGGQFARQITGPEQPIPAREHRGEIAVAGPRKRMMPKMEGGRRDQPFQGAKTPAHVRVDEKAQNVTSNISRVAIIVPCTLWGAPNPRM